MLAMAARTARAFSSYEMILSENQERIRLITLNRPKALNALCS